MFNRYSDTSKFITDINVLEKTANGLVYISDESDYDIAIDLTRCCVNFEGLKPLIPFIAEHLGELDNTVQRYDSLHQNNSDCDETPYIINSISIETPNHVTLEYFCTDVNSEFDVVFELKDGKFYLRQFGIVKNIADDWDKNSH